MRCVKMFHRPTATLENLPSDVRPPWVLKVGPGIWLTEPEHD